MSARFLIVDDDPAIRTFAAVLLADLAEIIEATNGDEALDLLREKAFDLVLLDWDMPGPNGLEVLKTIRTLRPRLPVIMVTGEAERVHVLKAIHAGASDYLVKPFENGALRDKVEKFCSFTPMKTVN